MPGGQFNNPALEEVIVLKKYLALLGATALSVVILLGGVYLGYRIDSKPESVAQEAADASTEYAVGATGSTAIPGYDTITFQAQQRTQYVPLENPAENDCYFVISILLQDGTELYRSGMIAPGTVVDCLRLKSAPVAGTYENSILRYSCWVMEDGEPHEVNGADTIFTLEVV